MKKKKNLSSCRRKIRLAVKPGRDELFMGDRLNLSILFLRQNRRFFVVEFFVKTKLVLNLRSRRGTGLKLSMGNKNLVANELVGRK